MDELQKYVVQVAYTPADQFGINKGDILKDATLADGKFTGTLVTNYPCVCPVKITISESICIIIETQSVVKDEEVVDTYHYHEALDRLHVIMCMIDDHVLSHPVCEKHSNVVDIIATGQASLAKAYQVIAQLDV